MSAHAAGVVHRDVKPANIILTPDRRALLTDFGVARQEADDTLHGSATEVTGHGFVVGSVRYMAPEQLRGEPATPASDQYGLAAVACQMLTGSPPFDGATPVAIAEAQAAGPPALREVDPPLAEAVRRGLAVDPVDRFPDVAAFARQSGRRCGPQRLRTRRESSRRSSRPMFPMLTRPDDPQPTARVARPPTVAIGAVVVALGLAGLVALASIGQPRSPGPDAVAPPSQEASAAPSPPPTAEPAVNTGGEQGGSGGNGGGKGKGRDDDKGKGKDKKN